MKTLHKLILVASILTVTSAFAAEAPKPIFHIWGGQASDQPMDSWNLVKDLPGQEIFGFSFKCIDGGPNLSVPDVFALHTTVNNASNGVMKYAMDISADVPNTIPDMGECNWYPLGIGTGVATSGDKRIAMIGLLAGGNGIVKAWNADTGALYYTLSFPQNDADGLSIAGYPDNRWSAVGNFLSNKSDQLRVGYSRLNPDSSLDLKFTYYDVLTGKQVGNVVSVNVPAPTAQ